MKLVMMKSGLKKTPFAIDYNFYIFENIISDVNFNVVSNIIKSKEKTIINSSPTSDNDGNTGLGDNSLTSRFNYFNVLDWQEPDIKKLKIILSIILTSFIKKYYKKDQQS